MTWIKKNERSEGGSVDMYIMDLSSVLYLAPLIHTFPN
jgi:hypothetical protein